MKRLLFAFCIGSLALASANAQEFSKFTFDLGGGFSGPVGSTGDYLNWGWNVGAGAGVNFSSHLGAMVNLGYDSMGINNTTVTSLGLPGGQVHVFHATVDPVVHLTPRGHFDFYLTGGGGVFHRYQEFSGTSGVTTTAYIPALGIVPGPTGATPITATYSVNRPGFDVGGGFAMGAFGKGKFFAEARWEHMFATGGHVDFLPLTFGFRW